MTRRRLLTSFCVLAFGVFTIPLGAADSAQQRAQVFESQTTRSFRLPYLLFLPAEYEKNINQRWPLILYLHGGSLRGTDIDSVRKLGLPHKIESEPNFPFIVVSPQCPAGEIWTDVDALDVAEKYPDTRSSLARWYTIMRQKRFANLVQLRKTFPHADQAGRFTVFNIGGNKVRLIAAVHYNRNKVYIRHVLTHQEYDTGKWKK